MKDQIVSTHGEGAVVVFAKGGASHGLENRIQNVRKVATIDEGRSTLEAAVLMTEEFIGAVVVTNASGIAGIFTERDLMMSVVGKKKDPETVTIREVMANTPLKVSPQDTRMVQILKRGKLSQNSLLPPLGKHIRNSACTLPVAFQSH